MNGRQRYALAAVVILLFHTLALAFLRAPLLASDLALCAAAALPLWALLRRTTRLEGMLRVKWGLFAVALLMWLAGQTAFSYYEVLRHSLQETALNSDFLFFLFGLPLLLVVSSSNEHKLSSALLVIDGLEVLLAVYLVRLQLFPSVGQGISASQLAHAYTAENILLVVVATVRILAHPRGEECRLYRTLCGFLWIYTLTAIPLNLKNVSSTSFWCLLWDVPFLLLALVLGGMPIAPALETSDALTPAEEERSPGMQTALLITGACPIFFTMALLIMSIYIAQTRFQFGVNCIILALLTYGLRNSLLQRRFLQAEHDLLRSQLALREANGRFEELSFLDPLTGVANRRRFQETFQGEWNRALRTSAPLSLLMMDLDHFKQLNDRYGHLHGDQCLVAVARSLAGHLRRSGELLARYGGEEFVAILPHVDATTALTVAEEMRAAVQRLGLPNEHPACAGRAMTLSIGIATAIPRPGDSLDALLQRADQALYLAKCEGRNRVHAGLLDDGGAPAPAAHWGAALVTGP